MKKIIVIIIILMGILAIQYSPNTAKAQIPEEIGVGEIIFEEKSTIPEFMFLTNDIGYTLIKLHLSIADKNLDQANYQWEALATIKKLEELTKKDIIETLYLAKDKKETLLAYLKECQNTLQKWDAIATYMKQEMNMIKGDMEICITQKNIYDKEYFDAIEKYDQQRMEETLAESIVYEKCAIENRIQYNAKGELVKKIVFYLGMLQKKYDMLFEKQDIVAKEFNIFQENILPDLNEIDKVLKQYDF